jgi:2-pyrone-4,6-dicarboxylate lactonase
MACPEPAHPDAALKHLHANGVCGARVNFVRHLSPNGFDKATCWQVVRPIEPLGWHLELHVDAADLARLRGFEGFADGSQRILT